MGEEREVKERTRKAEDLAVKIAPRSSEPEPQTPEPKRKK
jgi:hypothetical protein